jgi:heme/copper-type cytochrome/quinol oxidase subunit 2
VKRDDLADLRRNTAIWIAVVLWLGVSYLGATPPAGPYANAMQTAFTAFLALVIPLVSLLIAVAWVVALRGRGRGRQRDPPTSRG